MLSKFMSTFLLLFRLEMAVTKEQALWTFPLTGFTSQGTGIAAFPRTT